MGRNGGKGAPKGNKFWMNRLDMSVDGRKLSVKQVEEKLQEYIDRCVNDKLYSVDFVGKDAIEVKKPHMINMSIWGACVHLGISDSTWLEWKKDKKYSSILTRAESIFKAYNVEGASSGLLKENIIARIEGIKDKQETEHTGEIKTENKQINIAIDGKDIDLKL